MEKVFKVLTPYIPILGTLNIHLTTFFQKNLLLKCLSLYDCYFKYIVRYVMITSPALGTHS